SATRLVPLPGYSLSPIALAFAALCFFLSMRRHFFLEVTPFARLDLMDLVSDVMIVADAEGRLWDMNQAARTLFKVGQDVLFGRRVSSAIPALAPLFTQEPSPSSIDINLGGERRTFDVRISTTRDGEKVKWRIFVLHDETDRVRREEEIRQYAARLEEVDRLKDGFVAA